jgi:hypothetical protein
LSKRSNVETTVFFGVTGLGYFRNFCTLQLTLENRFVRNKGHTRSDDVVYDPRVAVLLTAHYSNFFVKFDK